MHKSNCRDAFRRAPDSLIDLRTGYNWYEPGASLRRHGDEFHEETKGPKGWLLPTRRSLTWLLYLNKEWRADEGGALRAYERARPCDHAVGATDDGGVLGGMSAGAPSHRRDFNLTRWHTGGVQVGWVGEDLEVPVFLGEAPHGERASPTRRAATARRLLGRRGGAAPRGDRGPWRPAHPEALRLARGALGRAAVPGHPDRSRAAPPLRQRRRPARGPRRRRSGGSVARAVPGSGAACSAIAARRPTCAI